MEKGAEISKRFRLQTTLRLLVVLGKGIQLLDVHVPKEGETLQHRQRRRGPFRHSGNEKVK